jgi:signal transduction histidine kinase
LQNDKLAQKGEQFMTESKDKILLSLKRAKYELDQAVADINNFPVIDADSVAFTAHAMNNFLTVTGGTVELMMLALKDHPDNEIHTWMNALQHSVDLMTHLVSRLMNTSTSKVPKMINEKIDLSVLGQRICDFYEKFADRKQIKIRFESSVKEPYVYVDRAGLCAVLDNLLSNAVKFTFAGGDILFHLVTENDNLICRIQDNGPGLSDEDQGMLFQRGAFLSATPTGGEDSTGYGLAVAKELIEILGGKIWCDSELGKGSVFSIQLPLYS